MAISALSALWFLPFVAPLCLYVAFTDMAQMRITNQAVVALVCIFCALGFWLLPLPDYLWRLAQLVGVLAVTFALNAAGVMGAGDSKFIAAGAPFVAPADVQFIIALFAAAVLAAFVTHRLVKRSPLRRAASHWQSWDTGKKFPMGFALGTTLAMYLALGLFWGA